jgi:copper chaperone NosL
MDNKLSVTSRILVAFASGALIAVFFLPAWRIDLFAPQYPEGLTMNIWINGLSGDVDIINGLNHYIGMKHVTADMFPEFRYLPFVVGFFMLLGMIVAITGKRKFLAIYLGLTMTGGALALYDFYQWAYDYGHNLDPTAPIQVPGLSYQPPLIGHKRLLNFDAYSFPDVGGWIVIGAGMLAFSVWFLEWYRQRKSSKSLKLSKSAGMVKTAYATGSIIMLMLVSSCSSGPEPFKYGEDICHTCKMGIVDPKFGNEIITGKGKVYKFDDANCLILFLRSGTVEEKDIRQKLVINFEKQNEFLDVNKSFFLVAPGIKSPMGGNAGAFSSRETAEKFNAGKTGVIYSWQQYADNIPKQ